MNPKISYTQQFGRQDGGRIDYVKSFFLVAIVVLLIAIINFMNLATAQSLRRAKEIGIRKATGATKSSLLTQFLGEAVTFSFIGLVMALIIVQLPMPAFRVLTGKEIYFPFANPAFMGVLLDVTLLTGLLSGLYPAFFLSSFDIVKVLKGTLKFGREAITLRRVLVIFQFSLTILLIFCSLVVYQQMQYIKKKNLGFDKENLVVINFTDAHREKVDLITNESNKVPGVSSVTVSTTSPLVGGDSTTDIQWPGKSTQSQIAITQMAVGYDYLSTMEIQIAEGRDFSREFPADSVAYVVNQEAVRIMNLDNPLGQVITFWGTPGPIIGVMKDYHFNSLHNPIEPVILHLHPQWSNLMISRIEADKTEEALDGLKELTAQISPSFPFDYYFVDDTFSEQYKAESTIGSLANYFTGMAIFISCLGLLGLISFTTQQRTKEIGVRKVLGASVSSIFRLLSKDFLLLLTIAFVLSTPLAWYLMNNWLDGFAYRTSINTTVFVAPGIVALGITLITISLHALRAAMESPVKSLWDE